MRAYSEDLRKKIVAATERGMSKALAHGLTDTPLTKLYGRFPQGSEGARPLPGTRASEKRV
jgi:hypothetical protein